MLFSADDLCQDAPNKHQVIIHLITTDFQIHALVFDSESEFLEIAKKHNIKLSKWLRGGFGAKKYRVHSYGNRNETIPSAVRSSMDQLGWLNNSIKD